MKISEFFPLSYLSAPLIFLRGETRIIDLPNMINTAVGNEAGVTFNPRRKWDTKPRLLASVDRAKKLIGYQPNTPFPEGLQLIALKLAFGVEIL